MVVPVQQQPARVARYNRAVVLDLIRRYGPVSKTDLAERTGLAASSVMNVIAFLSRRGLVRTLGLGPSTGGRPPALLELVPEAHFAVGVNIRSAVIQAVLVDLVGDIVCETVLPLGGSLDPVTVTGTVVEAVDQVVTLGRIDPARILGAGIGCPGPVMDGRIIIGGPSLPHWRHVPLADQLESALGLPVTLENDANLCALAEYRRGIGNKSKNCSTLVYVYADHGIGEGIVIDGKLFRGADGLAGELGHVVIDVDGPRCTCGGHGCLESLASIESIVRRAVVAARLGGPTSLHDQIGGDWDALTFEMVRDAAAGGDALSIGAIDEAIRYLAIGLSNVMRQFRPEAIVMGGGLVDHDPDVFARLQSAVNQRPSLYSSTPTRLMLGDLGAQAACIGAATLVLERFFGVPQDVINSSWITQSPEPAFEEPPLWPREAEEGIHLAPSKAVAEWAGNLQPVHLRVRRGEPVSVTLQVRLAKSVPEGDTGVKVLLHWDRVALYGANWTNPKNSPMQLADRDGQLLTYRLAFGTLPPGKYEFTAHVLAANDIWVRADARSDVNGRLEVLSHRATQSEEQPTDAIEPATVPDRRPVRAPVH